MYDFFDVSVLSSIPAFLLLLCIYWFSTRNHDFFAKKGIPYIKPYPFIGSIPGQICKDFLEMEITRYKTLGRTYGMYEGEKPVLVVAEPEVLKDIFVKDFVYFRDRRNADTGDEMLDKMLTVVHGEDWRRIRKLISPAFSTGKIRRITTIFEDCSNTLVQNFKEASKNGQPIDVLKIYGAFSMDVIASSSFSAKIDSHNDPNNVFVKMAGTVFNQNYGFKYLLFTFMPSILRLFRIRPFTIENRNFFKRVTESIIEERKRTGQGRNDFLQLVLDLASETTVDEIEEDLQNDIAANYNDESMNHPIFKKKISSRHITMNEIIAQCVIFFLAGYHTVTKALALTTYLLALNQDVQEKAFEEIKTVLSETDGKLTYESLAKFKYLGDILSEAMRMYPAVLRLERTAVADYEFRDSKLEIPENTIINIPVHAMHYDPEFFPEPEKFNPDRFNAENKDNIIPYTYLPFGSGPRNCIGMRFSLMEMKVCMVYILSVFQAQKCAETKVPLVFVPSSGLRTNQAMVKPTDVMLKMVLREDCPLKF